MRAISATFHRITGCWISVFLGRAAAEGILFILRKIKSYRCQKPLLLIICGNHQKKKCLPLKGTRPILSKQPESLPLASELQGLLERYRAKQNDQKGFSHRWMTLFLLLPSWFFEVTPGFFEPYSFDCSVL